MSPIASCIIGLLKHPDILKRAQEEIDSVIPFGELPTFDEEDKLPMVTAVCMETMRWRVVTPICTFAHSLLSMSWNHIHFILAVPHLLMQDDVYKGYRLPKGTVIVPNAWLVTHALVIVVECNDLV